MKKKKEQLLYDFKKFEKLDDNNLSEIIENLNKRTSSYIIKRRVECEGDFSSLEIDEQGEKVILKKKLSEIEKKLCMLELINFQRKFTNVVFELRKKVISKNYNNNLNTLEQLKQNQIEELEKIANKYK